MKQSNIELAICGQNQATLNPERQSIYHKAYTKRANAKKTNDPEKRKKLLKEAEELDKIWKSMKINTPKRMGMPSIPKSYFKY
jgi:hypothetical protein